MIGRRGRLIAASAAALLAACASGDEKPPPARLWTTADLVALARQGKSVGGLMPARALVTPRGQPLLQLSPPFADAGAVQRSDADGLVVYNAFSEGQPASYTTTEVWQNFPEVWVQPLYLPVTGFANGAPQVPPGARVVFGVSDRTRFYSPFWQVFYVVIPPGASHDLRSVKAVFDSGFEIIPGAGTFCAIAPPDVVLAQAEGAANPVRPMFGDRVRVNYAKAWVEGEEVSYVDFGRNRFTWEEYGVVEEAALFDLVVRGSDGQLVSLGLPRVGGTGPFLSGLPARVINGKPQFGALWRLHRALLPGTAGAFVPSTRPALRDALVAAAAAAGTTAARIAPPIAPQIEERPDVLDYTLRVAVNPSCFQDVQGFPGSCRWLDSQAAVEREIPLNAISETGILVTCPFLTYANQPVDP